MGIAHVGLVTMATHVTRIALLVVMDVQSLMDNVMCVKMVTMGTGVNIDAVIIVQAKCVIRRTATAMVVSKDILGINVRIPMHVN